LSQSKNNRIFAIITPAIVTIYWSDLPGDDAGNIADALVDSIESVTNIELGWILVHDWAESWTEVYKSSNMLIWRADDAVA